MFSHNNRRTCLQLNWIYNTNVDYYVNLLQTISFYFLITDVNDIDTPLENVTVLVVDIVSGYIAMKGYIETPINHFSQADIDNGKVIFVHKSKCFV